MGYVNNMNNHKMTTRSKEPTKMKSPTVKMSSSPPDGDDIDEYGNLPGLIDYECQEELSQVDQLEFRKQLKSLGKSSILLMDFPDEGSDTDGDYTPSKKNKKIRKRRLRKIKSLQK